MPSTLRREFRPGDTAPQSGQYQEHEPRLWARVRDVLVPKGGTFPATRHAGGFFTLVDPSRPEALPARAWSSD